MKTSTLVAGLILSKSTAGAQNGTGILPPCKPLTTQDQQPPCSPYFEGKVWALASLGTEEKAMQMRVNVTQDGATQSMPFLIPLLNDSVAVDGMFNLLIAAYISRQRICISYVPGTPPIPHITGVYYPSDARYPDACRW